MQYNFVSKLKTLLTKPKPLKPHKVDQNKDKNYPQKKLRHSKSSSPNKLLISLILKLKAN